MIHEFIFSMVHIKILQHEIHLMNSYEIKRDKKQKKCENVIVCIIKGENLQTNLFVYFFLGALITKTPSELKLEVI